MTDRPRLAATCLVLACVIAACSGVGSTRPTTMLSPTPSSPGSAPGSAASAASVEPTAPILHQPWASAELTDVATGEVFRIADHAGKVIIIETMAIWCPTCLRQGREVEGALARLDPAKVKYVVLDVDLHEDAAALARYQDEYQFGGTYAVAGIPVARALAEEFGANMLNPPLTPIVIVGTDGTATLTDYGVKSADEIVSLATGAGA